MFIDVHSEVTQPVVERNRVPLVVQKIPLNFLFDRRLPSRLCEEHDAFIINRELHRVLAVLLREQITTLKKQTYETTLNN